MKNWKDELLMAALAAAAEDISSPRATSALVMLSSVRRRMGYGEIPQERSFVLEQLNIIESVLGEEHAALHNWIDVARNAYPRSESN
jgi:hypothetical protein